MADTDPAAGRKFKFLEDVPLDKGKADFSIPVQSRDFSWDALHLPMPRYAFPKCCVKKTGAGLADGMYGIQDLRAFRCERKSACLTSMFQLRLAADQDVNYRQL